MGDPRKTRRKYAKPAHPWQAERLEKERKTIKDFGLKNKQEIWRMGSLLKGFKSQVKDLIRRTDPQSKKEEDLLKDRLVRMGIIEEGSKLENILDLNIDALLERRLETQVFKKGLARSMKQARQFIVHGHIRVDDKKVTVPSYMLMKGEENKLAFKPTSPLSDPDHAERKPVGAVAAVPKTEEKEETKEEAKTEEAAAQ